MLTPPVGWPPAKNGFRLETADTRRPVQLWRQIKRSRFTAIRVSALVLFAAVEDAVGAAKNGLLAEVVGEAHARTEC